jgi:hypothetical protein
LAGLADTACGRVPENELVEMAEFAAEIQPKDTGKGRDLLKALKIAFTELKKRGANRKAIIFTENRSTIGFLHVLLSDKYKTLAFDGSKSSDYSVIKKFEHDSENAEILIATNIAAEGFNLEFCSFVVNFDLPYNVLTIEQRIMRCHRQGQLNDVVVLNFLNKQNFADVRMLELINKRVSQFDGIIGMSDDVVGNFCDNAVDGLTAAFGKSRHKRDIESAFRATLAEHESQNISAVQSAENALFTTFTRDIADKITITPQYIKDRTAEINDKLWELTKWFFSGKSGYDCINESRTVEVGITPQKVFTGAALRRREYSMSDRTLTLTSAITRNMLNEIYWQGIPDSGTVVIRNSECEIRNCEIAYYVVKIKQAGSIWHDICYDVFVGKTIPNSEFSIPLSDEDCRRIMDLPVVEFTATGESYGIRDGNKSKLPNPLDELVCVNEYIRRAASDTDDSRSEEIAVVTEKSRREKSLLNREVESLKNELRQIENALTRTSAVTERVVAEKRKATASRELKRREQSLFMDSMRVDVDLEEQIKAITEQANLTAVVKRQFVIQIRNSKSGIRNGATYEE